MNKLAIFFASMTPEELMEAKRRAKPAQWTGEVGAICAAVGLVTLLLLAWAWFTRKKRRQREQSGDRATSRAANQDLDRPDALPEQRSGRRRKRRRRRAHRPRNPTLAETGGLPPVRPEDATEFDYD